MANYEAIQKLRPGVTDFIIHRQYRHQGDVLFFPPNVQSNAFTTDRRGFRHTIFDGKTLSVADILKRDDFGLVLGGSRGFGFGIAGNENAMPSLLSQRFGFPFANLALFQGNSRNLFALLNASLANATKAPAAVVHFSGGDLGSFAATGIADAIFGSPNAKLLRTVREERKKLPPIERSVRAMLKFTSLWTRSIAQLCHAFEIPLVLVHDTTFFEKREPSALDREAELGVPYQKWERPWFKNHKAYAGVFYDCRSALAGKLGVPIAGPLGRHDLSFIDEFHYDEEGIKALTDDVAAALKPLVRA